MYSIASHGQSLLGTGTIVAVCASSKTNVPKYMQKEAEIGEYGFVGDIHAGPTRISRKTGTSKFNDRQISIVAQEDLDFLNTQLGTALKPGDMGENITTKGLGSLSSLVAGMSLGIGERIILEVIEQNNPCKNLSAYHRLLVKVSFDTRRRGVFAIVRVGAGLKVRSGDLISLYSSVPQWVHLDLTTP